MEEVYRARLAAIQNATSGTVAIHTQILNSHIFHIESRDEGKRIENLPLIRNGIVHLQKTVEAEGVSLDRDDSAHAGGPTVRIDLVENGNPHARDKAAGVFHRGDHLAIIGVENQLALDSRSFLQQ